MIYQDSISFGGRLSNEKLLDNGTLEIFNVNEGNVGAYECSILSTNSPKITHKVVLASKPKITSISAIGDKTEVKIKKKYKNINKQMLFTA